MDALELSGREHVRATLVGLDLKIDTLAFLQEPENTLGAGLFKPEEGFVVSGVLLLSQRIDAINGKRIHTSEG
jgi:hypothetical protein